jgi:hypothetical protein
MATYHALVHVPSNTVVIRNATEGITDHEFSMKVRNTGICVCSTKQEVENQVTKNLKVVSKEAWNDLMYPSGKPEYEERYVSTFKGYDTYHG